MSTQNQGAYFDVARLEQRLQVWAESSFLYLLFQFMKGALQGYTMEEFNRKKREVLEFPDLFRQHLLKATTEPFNPDFGLHQHRNLKGEPDTPDTRWHGCGTFARQLHEWNKKSRVVYHIDDDLRVLLQASSFHSATWDKIPWPFDSFVLTLEKPVEIRQGVETDTILFSKLKNKRGEDLLTFSFLPVQLARYETLSEFQKHRFFLMLKRNNFEEVKKMLGNSVQKRLDAGVYSFSTVMDAESAIGIRLDNTKEVDDTAEGFGWKKTGTECNGNVCIELATMVAAFALYLTTLPPGQPTPRPKNSAVPPAIKKQDPRLISAPSKVCHLTSAFKLTPEEKEGLEDAMRKERTGMVLPHWRRGFFRRPNGLGHDPTAPRTIWVRPTFVNKHHLPDGTLPGGAYVKVEGPEDDKV